VCVCVHVRECLNVRVCECVREYACVVAFIVFIPRVYCACIASVYMYAFVFGRVLCLSVCVFAYAHTHGYLICGEDECACVMLSCADSHLGSFVCVCHALCLCVFVCVRMCVHVCVLCFQTSMCVSWCMCIYE
jgi:hypothetical protein